MTNKEKLRDLRGKLKDRRDKAAAIVTEAGPDLDMDKVTSVEGDSAAKVAAFQALQKEMGELKAEMEPLEAEEKSLTSLRDSVDQLGQVERQIPAPTNGNQQAVQEYKGIGDLFVESLAYTGWHRGMKDGPVAHIDDFDMHATLFQTSAGWAPFSPRGPRVVDLATRPLAVADLFPQGSTTSPSIVFMEETTFTNAAVEVAEGAAKPEATLALTERTEPVRKIAVWIPVTDEQLADVAQARSYIENRLGFMVRQRLDSQLLVGDGTAPNISGILDRVGIQTQAKGADPSPDAVYKGMTKVRSIAFSEPNAAVFHPNDWQDIRLLRTADGIYIWGAPYDSGVDRIWGIRVVVTTAMTENTGLVGDFNQAELVMRSGVDLAITDSHASLFISNQLVVRAELRAALAVYRPAAFCSITGL